MKCYVCAKEGVETPAVAMCIVCGMFVCMHHLVREELPVEDIAGWGRRRLPIPKHFPAFSACGAMRL